MKNLTLHTGKLIACAFLIALMLLQSCRKETAYLSNPQIDVSNKQLIKQDAIVKWFEANPATELLTLDWKNAKQTSIDGKM